MIRSKADFILTNTFTHTYYKSLILLTAHQIIVNKLYLPFISEGMSTYHCIFLYCPSDFPLVLDV